jgi:prepilin-type processing-associated H-X9-DG protein
MKTASSRRMSNIAVARHRSKPAGAAPKDIGPGPVKLSGGMNRAFFDGHAGRLPIENLWTDTWHKA